MMNDVLRQKLRDLPDKPGCYLMRNRAGKIIYVGKAVSLRKRVQSYFRRSTLRKAPPKLRSLINSVEDLDVIVVRNEAEALLTEGQLIKDYKPRFNVVFRDDKRYLAVRAERHLALPRFAECRIIRDDGDEYFGPYPSSGVVRTVKGFAERRFGIRQCTVAEPDADTHKHCHNDRIAHCSAPCIGAISPEDYRARFEEACAFLRNGDPAIVEEIREAMAAAAADLDFERAAKLRDTIAAIDDLAKQRARVVSPPHIPKLDAVEGCEALAAALDLPTTPQVIEGFDISHISGTLTVASMVVSVDGVPTPQRYRRFRIRSVEGVDDPASIAEVVHRRYARSLAEDTPLPDLVMVDGGITQLRAARAALAMLGLEHIPSVGLAEQFEEIVVDRPGMESILLERGNPALNVLVRLRDEAHRFAITYNRNLRRKRIRESVLDEIEGVGETRKTLLLKQFGSIRRLAAAPVEAIAAVGGIGEALAHAIKAAALRTSPPSQ
ncbi:MAG: excinuclease ABC subunit UvrC [Kiritimatiellia bacterium]|jgi:excinuclease ABC subunit C